MGNIKDFLDSGVPIGGLFEFGSSIVNPPTGYLKATIKQTLLQSAYPALFAIYGLAGDIAPTETWTKNTTGIPNTVDDLQNAYFDGNTYALPGSNGKLWTATDPEAAWSVVSDVAFGTGNFLAIIKHNGKWAMSGTSVPTLVTADTLSGPWTATSFPSGGWGTAFATDGTIVVSVGNVGQIRTSTDLINWTVNTTGVPNTTDTLRSVHFANNLWVAVGDNGAIWTATDPKGAWTKNTSPTTATDDFVKVSYGNGTWVAGQGVDLTVWTATDAQGAWTKNPNLIRYIPTYDKDSGYWILVADGIETTLDPTGATSVITASPVALKDVIVGGSHFLGVGMNGEIWTAPRFSYNTQTQFVVNPTIHADPSIQYFRRAL